MSKKIQKGSVAEIITKSLNKHGEIKGSNKKETRNLKAMCNHHKITKKGKEKPMVYNNGNGQCTCTMCNSSFPTHLANKDDVNKESSKIVARISQAKFMAAAAGLGKETETYLSKLAVEFSHFPKVYSKIKSVVEKSENIKKKKKNKGYDSQGGSESYGGWR